MAFHEGTKKHEGHAALLKKSFVFFVSFVSS